MYLVVAKDTHSDDAYYPFLNRDKALLKAKELADEAMAHYKHDKPEVYPVRDNVIFNMHDMAGSWQVLVYVLDENPNEIRDILTDLTDVQVWYEDYHSRSYCIFCGKIDNSMCEHHNHCAYARAKEILKDMP